MLLDGQDPKFFYRKIVLAVKNELPMCAVPVGEFM